MKTQRNANNIAIVAIAYALNLGAELISSASFYYLFSMLVNLLVMSLCYYSNSKLIKVYGVLNFISLVLYLPLVFFPFELSRLILWSGVVNFANITLSFEILILIRGTRDGLRIIANRAVDGWFSILFSVQNNQEHS